MTTETKKNDKFESPTEKKCVIIGYFFNQPIYKETKRKRDSKPPINEEATKVLRTSD